MRAVWQSFVDFFTSSKLTVWLLVLSMALVFLATLDQRTLGVLGIQQKWFHTFIVIHFVGGFPVPVFPGGCTIGALLFLNLAAAFVCRFTFAWKNCGVWLTHAGLVLLLAGGFLNGFMQEDYQMRLREGETKNYSESFHRYELAIIDATPAAHDNAAAPAASAAHDNAAAFAVSAAHDNAITIPENILARAKPAAPFDLRDGGDGGADGGGALPFRVTIRAYYRNAVLVRPGSDPRFASLPTATDGIGRRVLAVPVSPTWRQNESNQPAVYVEISAPQNTALAPLPPQPSLPLQPPQPSLPSQPPQPPQTWLLSSQLGEPQIFDCAGRHWRMELRPARRHTDFSLTLLKVTHDVYAGSSIPKNYASLVLLRAPGDPAGREVRIHMNAPLRHGGLAFYQYQMRAEAGESVLQVVSNPGWLIPYIACALMGLGLIVQFSISLIHFGKRSSATPAGAVCYSEMAAAPPRSSALQRAQEVAKKTKHLPNIFLRALPKIFPSILSKIFPKILPNILPLAALFAATLWLAASSRPGKNATPFDIAGFSRLHVKADGRGKPLDTVARATLLRLQGRQNVRNAAGRALEPAEWLLDAAFRPEVAADYRVFEITQPELLALAHLTTADGDGGKRFSFAQLQHALDAITAKARQAGARIPADRDGFDRAVLVLHGNLAAYRNLEYSLAPPAGAFAAAPLGAFVAPPAGVPGGAPASNTLRMMAQFGSLLAIPPAASAAPVASATSAASTASATPATPAASVTPAAPAASGASAAPVAPDGEWRKPGEVLLTDAQNKTVTPAALAY
ncbi:MAG: cytochrome c biogenesis protein ResB, partial [Opitutaceae bacterium]|nr:cytochrome c biogenesis protein ResB [Opitutaceae bacterium]